MKTKPFFTVLMVVSVAFNVFFIGVVFISTVLSKSYTARLSFPAPEEGYLVAATITSIPTASPLVFNSVEIDLRPKQKAFIQYSVFAAKNQNNLLINALYDPEIIAVSQTSFGIEITALREGETLMQTITNRGIVDIALITITE
jgi:hypothetical protein